MTPPGWRIAAIGAAVLLLIGWLALHDRRVIDKHDARIEAAASAARDQAADERTQDAVTNTRNEQDLHHAIDGAPTGGSLSPAAHSLACERLRKLGRFPPSCGLGSSDGGQAGAR